jgi:hypothetical protein
MQLRGSWLFYKFNISQLRSYDGLGLLARGDVLDMLSIGLFLFISSEVIGRVTQIDWISQTTTAGTRNFIGTEIEFLSISKFTGYEKPVSDIKAGL